MHRLRRPTSSSASSPSIDPVAALLCQWKHRGRILLLVYPTPALAYQSLTAYAALGPENDTVVYVGEGRGGANAQDDFFDVLEGGGDNDDEYDSGWVLLEVLPVRPFGSNGFEKLFIFRKRRTTATTTNRGNSKKS